MTFSSGNIAVGAVGLTKKVLPDEPRQSRKVPCPGFDRAARVERVFDTPQRQRGAGRHHPREAGDLGDGIGGREDVRGAQAIEGSPQFDFKSDIVAKTNTSQKNFPPKLFQNLLSKMIQQKVLIYHFYRKDQKIFPRKFVFHGF